MKPAFFQLIHHPVSASANLANLLVSAGQNNLRGSQARYSTNALADQVQQLFEKDFDFEQEYHTILDGQSDFNRLQYWHPPLTDWIIGKWDQCVLIVFLARAKC